MTIGADTVQDATRVGLPVNERAAVEGILRDCGKVLGHQRGKIFRIDFSLLAVGFDRVSADRKLRPHFLLPLVSPTDVGRLI